LAICQRKCFEGEKENYFVVTNEKSIELIFIVI